MAECRWILVAVTLLCVLAAGHAPAADERLLQVNLSPLTIKPRTDAIQHLDAHFDWRGRNLLRGRLELRVGDGASTRLVCRSPELALVPGEQTLRLTLPPVDAVFGGGQIYIDMAFLAGDRRLPLGETTLFATGAHERSLLVAVVAPLTAPRHDDLVRSLQLERYRPTGQGEALSTTLGRIFPESLPPQPLGYTAFDVVILQTSALPDVSGEMMDSLGLWLRGGGSLVLLADAPLPAEHVARLNGWAADAGLNWRLTVDAAGRPMPDVPPQTLLRIGLGRLAVLTTAPDPRAPAWREAVAFLWRLRPAQRQALVEHEAWRADVEQKSPQRQATYGPYGSPYGAYPPQQQAQADAVQILPMQPLPTIGAHELIPALMPSTVRLVPFGLVVLILVGFTVAVGPGDYLLLGLIRRRRWTWVVFPLTAVGFTAATIALSEGWMGRTDVRRSLTVVDVGRGGEVLRESRFELLFPGRTNAVIEPVDRALLTPVDHNQLGGYPYYYDPYAQERLNTAPPLFEGRVPGGYVLRQQVSQWTPRLTRSLRLPDDAQEATLQWDALRMEDLRAAGSHRGRQGLLAKLQLPGSFDGSVFLMHGSSRHVLKGVPNPLAPRTPGGDSPYAYSGYMPFDHGFGDDSFLAELSARHPEGFFSIVFAISPCGGESFEDLAVLDETDEREAMIVAVWRDGDDLRMVRRLYHEE